MQYIMQASMVFKVGHPTPKAMSNYNSQQKYRKKIFSSNGAYNSAHHDRPTFSPVMC